MSAPKTKREISKQMITRTTLEVLEPPPLPPPSSIRQITHYPPPSPTPITNGRTDRQTRDWKPLLPRGITSGEAQVLGNKRVALYNQIIPALDLSVYGGGGVARGWLKAPFFWSYDLFSEI